MPRGLVAMARSGGHCPLRVSGGILCSERGQSRDAFQAIRLEETSPRCNKSRLRSTHSEVRSSKCLLGQSETSKLRGNFLSFNKFPILTFGYTFQYFLQYAFGKGSRMRVRYLKCMERRLI